MLLFVGGIIENCINFGNVGVGGIVGSHESFFSNHASRGEMMINNCVNYGDIVNGGGILGTLEIAYNTVISNCYNMGNSPSRRRNIWFNLYKT